ncbi:MAG: hypothetical protein ACO3HA_05715 [Burkholderiales bacterium]
MPNIYQGVCSLSESSYEVPVVLLLHLGRVAVLRAQMRMEQKKLLIQILGKDYLAVHQILEQMPNAHAREKALAAAIRDRWSGETCLRYFDNLELATEVDRRVTVLIEGNWAKPAGCEHSAVLFAQAELKNFYIAQQQFGVSQGKGAEVDKAVRATKIIPLEYKDADFIDMQRQLDFVISEVKGLALEIKEARHFVAMTLYSPACQTSRRKSASDLL